MADSDLCVLAFIRVIVKVRIEYYFKWRHFSINYTKIIARQEYEYRSDILRGVHSERVCISYEANC